MPSVQYVGISLLSHIVVKSGRSISAASSRSAMSNSALRFSVQGLFYFGRDCSYDLFVLRWCIVLTYISCSAFYLLTYAVSLERRAKSLQCLHGVA